MISNDDLLELRRVFTNSYNSDKQAFGRIMQGINSLNAEIQRLKGENQKNREMAKEDMEAAKKLAMQGYAEAYNTIEELQKTNKQLMSQLEKIEQSKISKEANQKKV